MAAMVAGTRPFIALMNEQVDPNDDALNAFIIMTQQRTQSDCGVAYLNI